MPQLPFEIPKSLASYAEHFDSDPIKATTRLKKQLKKRGPDAVGHFLLAWFYHLKGMDDLAVEEALKARIYAPGSPFFEKLHYYLSHPNTLEAWTPTEIPYTSEKKSTSYDPGPVLDLDTLIQKLSAVESKRIKPEQMEPGEPSQQKGTSDDIDGIASETLASIHEKQGKFDMAIQTYLHLRSRYQENKEHYNEQIQRIRKRKEESSNSAS
ncbi:hypothetical protein [Fodinibius halophilus]|uniref:Tetratricopeptide repeat protein n=1 Tax=Fodinibius halophilus TaxID=1736908 RepID=A0A6M1T3F6_9BACT|nr:hypothetical protein [Fodinibius halophilus]NGP89966.1 hypothetical protein [Fodinibius halophilus]